LLGLSPDKQYSCFHEGDPIGVALIAGLRFVSKLGTNDKLKDGWVIGNKAKYMKSFGTTNTDRYQEGCQSCEIQRLAGK
jgi:hypothetical protein